MTGRSIATLDAGAADRVVKLLGLLGSAYDGEVATAGRMADELLRRHGLTWPDVIRVPAPEHKPAPHWREPESWREALELASQHPNILTQWEMDFVHSLRRNKRPLSDKQTAIIDDIVDKIRTHFEARAA